MGVLKAVGIDEIMKRGSIKDIDVLKLRAAYYEDGQITEDEAEMLFAVNAGSPVQDPVWAPFFIEAITDYIVNQAEPEGYITATNADWLIKRVAKSGRVDSKTGLDLLINVVEKARWSPASLARFALEQVKLAVFHGDGPLRVSGTTARPEIGEADVELLRRIIYAFGGDGNVGVTRSEAEVLFDINDALGEEPPHPAWTSLFVKAIANSVMASSGYAVPSREEALRRDEWLDSRNEFSLRSVAGAFSLASLKSIWSGYREQSSEERALARLERQRIEIITSEEITEGEAAWLIEQIGRDGKPSLGEQALLAFFKSECPSLLPSLAEVIERCHRAA